MESPHPTHTPCKQLLLGYLRVLGCASQPSVPSAGQAWYGPAQTLEADSGLCGQQILESCYPEHGLGGRLQACPQDAMLPRAAPKDRALRGANSRSFQ